MPLIMAYGNVKDDGTIETGGQDINQFAVSAISSAAGSKFIFSAFSIIGATSKAV